MNHCRNHAYYHDGCYDCLEARRRFNTRTIDDDGNDLLSTVIAAEVVSNVFSSGDTPSVDTSPSFTDTSSSDTSSFDSGFGGDSGGGGASGDF